MSGNEKRLTRSTSAALQPTPVTNLLSHGDVISITAESTIGQQQTKVQRKRKLTVDEILIDADVDLRRGEALVSSSTSSSKDEPIKKLTVTVAYNNNGLRQSSRLSKQSTTSSNNTNNYYSNESSSSCSSSVASSTAANEQLDTSNSGSGNSTLARKQSKQRKQPPTPVVDATEQEFLNNIVNEMPVEEAEQSLSSKKIITRRRSSNLLLNQLRLNNVNNCNGGSFLDKSFPNMTRKRALNHSIELGQSLKPQQMSKNLENQPNNIENLINDSSTSSPINSQSSTTHLHLSSKRISQKHKYAFKELSINENETPPPTSINLNTSSAIGPVSISANHINSKRHNHHNHFSHQNHHLHDESQTNSIKKEKQVIQISRSKVKNGLTLNDEDANNNNTNNTVNNKTTNNNSNTRAEEELHCRVQGCNSAGNLDGTTEQHYSYDKCPVYFGMSLNECKKRKAELESKLKELNEKLARINENKKTLRNKKPNQEQLEYQMKLIQELKVPATSKSSHRQNQKLSNKQLLPETTPELLGDIKNLTTSFIISSVTNSLAPTPMPHFSASLPGTTVQHHNHHPSNVNFLNSLTQTTAYAPSIDDLGVSALEVDLFHDVLVSGMNEYMPQNVTPDVNKRLRLLREGNKLIQFGNFEIETWYKSPYPDDFWQLEKIFLCQFCLQYMKSHTVLSRHLEKCVWRHPPGREIYRKELLSFFEVDGKFNKLYCQNLCLLAKLFLDHKTLYFDVEPFLFYVLTQYDEKTGSFQMIGYFSKEKQSLMNYNLSCILILPQFMNKSYGRLLIDFSYLLSRVEGKIGSPERPLSDLGLLSYRSYWKSKVLGYLAKHLDENEISAKEISTETGILSNDIISTLQYIGLIKYWKGKHVILKDKDIIEEFLNRKYSCLMDVDQACLKWTPYVYNTIINDTDSPTPVFRTNKQSTLAHE